jgi:hypothetical protein
MQKPFIDKTQTSVVRSNCMDCLDRTNVVQSAIGKWVLSRQLQQLQILRPGENIDEQIDFMHLYRKGRYYSGQKALLHAKLNTFFIYIYS